MNRTKYLFLLLIIMILASCSTKNGEPSVGQETDDQKREFYALKVYTFDTDKQVQTTDAYLRAALLPALDRREIGPVGVFKSRINETDTVRKTFVLIPFISLAQFADLEKALATDEAYLSNGEEYINAPHDRPPYRRFETILLEAFEDMPKMQTPAFDSPRLERVYELRSYESPTETYYRNKVDMFNAGGEIKLFEQLEFNAVFYGEVLAGSNMPNLMYMTTFADMESRDAHWEAFVESPEWKEMSALEKYQNNVSHADIMLLYPAAYSDY